jgi:hypothetical protein
MSTCISRAGEYSAHETEPGNYICDRCGVLDEDGVFADLDALRATLARATKLADEWERTTTHRWPSLELRAALDGA